MTLRHSHIAFRGAIKTLAQKFGLNHETGEDDLGEFYFFDVSVRHERSTKDQIVRFASHRKDHLVHLLAENINSDEDLGAALLMVGPISKETISVSVDQNGKALRDIDSIYKKMEKFELKSIDEKPIAKNIKRLGFLKIAQGHVSFTNDSSQQTAKSRPVMGRLSTKSY